MAKRNRNRYQLAAPARIGAAAPTLATPQGAPVQSDAEYISGYGLSFGAYMRQLGTQPADATAPEVTFETYRQMMNDPEVSSDVRTLRDMVLADGVQLSPAADGKPIADDSPEYARANEIAEFCQRAMLATRKPLKKTLKGLLEGALAYGHKTAEITWKIGTGIDRGRLVLDRVALKDHRTLNFVVDAFWNLIGFAPRQGAQGLGTQETIPREKFIHLSLHEEDEDPRGRSSIRPVYTAWCFKLLAWPEYRRWLENCALPPTIGKLAPKQPGDVQRNADGTKKSNTVVSPAEAFGQALASLKNASYMVVPNGAEVDQLQSAGDGGGFERAIGVADGQIAKGILYQTLATGEAQFGTRAQSETHMGVLDLLVWELKGEVADVISSDLIRQIVRYNFGDDALRFAPLVSLGDSERRDWSKDARAAAMLESAVTDSQWNAITTQLGLPAPLPGERPRREESATPQPENQPPQPQRQPLPDDTEDDAPPQRPTRPNGAAFVTIRRIRA